MTCVYLLNPLPTSFLTFCFLCNYLTDIIVTALLRTLRFIAKTTKNSERGGAMKLLISHASK